MVQPVSQSLVPALRSCSIVIPPRMLGHAPGRRFHLPLIDPRPTRSATTGSRLRRRIWRRVGAMQLMLIIPVGIDLDGDLNLDDAPI